ncbi:MAG: hypothetical protein NWE76_06005 [Candidatus Bathyarchaeota archaeon]|nr:hypothetical protein [Candidatus Bathyarchaeota archaeon]
MEVPIGRRTPFQRFAQRNFPMFNPEESHKERLLHFYEYWTDRTEQYSSYTYDVTQLQDEAFVQELIGRGFHKTVPLAKIRQRIDRLPTTVNGGKPKKEVF